MKDHKVKERFIELRAQGRSFDHIAGELRIAKQTLINWSKEFELEIKNLKAIELESLQERYFMRKAQRIEMFGELLQAVRHEIKSRDLSSLPTERLFDLFFRLENRLKQEAIDAATFTGQTSICDEAELFGKRVTWQA